MSRHRSLALAGAAALAACAGAARTPPPGQVNITPNTVRVETPGGTLEARTTAEDRADARSISAAVDAAWAKLPTVYNELSLPVTLYVDRSRQIGSRGLRVRGRLGNVRVSTLVTCGMDVTGDDKANSYELTLEVQTALGQSATAGHTDVLTMVTATGRPMATSGEPVRCVSTGALERRIASVLAAKTAAP